MVAHVGQQATLGAGVDDRLLLGLAAHLHLGLQLAVLAPQLGALGGGLALQIPVPREEKQQQAAAGGGPAPHRSEEHTSELQSLMRISYAVFCLKKKKKRKTKS